MRFKKLKASPCKIKLKEPPKKEIVHEEVLQEKDKKIEVGDMVEFSIVTKNGAKKNRIGVIIVWLSAGFCKVNLGEDECIVIHESYLRLTDKFNEELIRIKRDVEKLNETKADGGGYFLQELVQGINFY